jgi:hypothetical protein
VLVTYVAFQWSAPVERHVRFGAAARYVAFHWNAIEVKRFG